MPTYTNVVEYKRGATHADGTPRFCLGCQIEGDRKRRRRATVTAISRPTGKPRSKRKLPVAYCAEHWAEALEYVEHERTEDR